MRCLSGTKHNERALTMAEEREIKSKGGRPSKDPAGGKRPTITFRCRSDLQSQLQAAAIRSDKSVSEEIEYRLMRSFDYQSVDECINEAFVRYMRVFFGEKNNPTAMAVFARWWERSIAKANKEVKSDTEWFNDELKQTVMSEVLRHGIPGVIKDAASSEQWRLENTSEADR